MNDWIVWQLLDSAFPTGGFAHSGGLEAAWRAGLVTDENSLIEYVAAQLCQWANGPAPLVRMAAQNPGLLIEADRRCDLLLNHPVSNRASRAQGRALIASARRIYPLKEIEELAANAPSHLAPAFGAVCHGLSVSPNRAEGLFLFIQLRGAISAAVRLGILGPMAGQAIQYHLSRRADDMAAVAMTVDPDQIAQTAPLAELFAGSQDRLYSRLFQS
jgi:urease accessory protein